MKMPIDIRFDDKWQPVTDCGCYLWSAATNAKGYGKFSIGPQKWVLAHRYAYERAKGSLPPGVIVCHKCDNPSCVNPDHLFSGTHKDNAKDRDSKNRRVALRGENHGRSKLNEQKVFELRKLAAEKKFSYASLGKLFGINRKTASDIVNRNIWSHI